MRTLLILGFVLSLGSAFATENLAADCTRTLHGSDRTTSEKVSESAQETQSQSSAQGVSR